MTERPRPAAPPRIVEAPMSRLQGLMMGWSVAWLAGASIV